MTESEPTRGHYTFVHQFNVECDRRGIANCGGYSPSHGQQEAFEENKANALLVADAFNVYNETGLTPRQLLEQRDALISVMRNFCNWAMDVKNGADLHPGRLEDYRIGFAETIAKTKQVQG